MTRVGIVGTGFMGRTHAAAWAQTPAQIAGFTSLDSEQLQQLSNQYQAKRYADLDSLIAAVDVVDICTPTDTHHPIVLQAAAAGKHIICEKPLARTLAQGKEMIAACENAGVHLLVGHVVRFFPEYAQAKAIVDRGDIGQVAVVRLKRCSSQPGWAADNWLSDPAKSGGMILDLMVHDLDYARWMAGDVESVFAKSALGMDPTAPTDYAVVILRHKNGALSNVEGAWAYPKGLFHTALEIAGESGLIEHPTGSSVPLGIYLKEPEDGDTSATGNVPTSPLAEDPYTTQIKHFYQVLTGAVDTPRVTAADALAALQIGLAALQSAQTGQPVLIEEVQ